MPELDPQDLLKAVKENKDYSALADEFVLSVIRKELPSSKTRKDAVKAIRSKLHQVGNAYYPQKIDYALLLTELEKIPADGSTAEARSYIQRILGLHASTKERLPFHEELMSTILDASGPVDSLQDLACGFNPVSFPLFPQLKLTRISVCEIYEDQIQFLKRFLVHFKINGTAVTRDLTSSIPTDFFHLTLLFKTIPCLEQVDKQIAARLLSEINSEHLAVTFPVTSLSGKSKGMRKNYADRFLALAGTEDWHIQRYDFTGELLFLLSKKARLH